MTSAKKQERLQHLKEIRGVLRRERRVLTRQIAALSARIARMKRELNQPARLSLNHLHDQVMNQLAALDVIYHDGMLYCPKGKFFAHNGLVSVATTCREGTRRWYRQILQLLGEVREAQIRKEA